MPTVTQGTNSFMTEAEATSYFGERLHASGWTSAATATQTAALIQAAKLLDLRIKWKGLPAETDQAMAWPRQGAYDLDGIAIDNDEVPQCVKDAQAELALILLGQDTTAPPDTAGISALSVGTITLQPNTGDRIRSIPDPVFELISHLGTRTGGPGAVEVTLG